MGRNAHPKTIQAERQLLEGLAEQLMASDVLDWFAEPRGQEHPEWPEWVKPRVSGRSRLLGCSEFIGDEPYTEPTPRQLDAFKDFIPDDCAIRLKSASVREAIGTYMPDGLFFKQWLPLFTDLLDRPAYYLAVWGALERITHQFNLRPPEYEASSEAVTKYLERGPNLARYVLSFAQNRIEARDHPELVVAMAMFQASHRCFIDGLTNHLQAARMQGRLSADRWDVAYAVIDGPFRQFDDFMIFSTLFPLTLHVRAQLAAKVEPDAQDYRQLTVAAITEAWDTFTKKRIVRREFAEGSRMICPANQHLRAAKDYGVIEKLFEFVYDHAAAPHIHRLLNKARQEATNAAYFRQSGYREGLAEAVYRNRNARGGKGLEV